LRSSELCALRWEDIDLKDGTLLVRKGKGGRQRLLFLNDRILGELQQYYKETGKDEDGPVFAALTNNQHTKKSGARSISQSALVDMIRNHAKANGFKKKISPKTFRHTFATHMLEVGTPLEAIKEMLGHDDETETCIYIHVSVDAARSLLEKHIANFK
jgi:site-specific recombinase XerD